MLKNLHNDFNQSTAMVGGLLLEAAVALRDALPRVSILGETGWGRGGWGGGGGFLSLLLLEERGG
jgi:hypothetical protein